MKTIAVPCEVDGKKVPIQFHVGDPHQNAHPIGHQAAWLGRERGVYVPQDVMDSMDEINVKAKEMGVPFEELVAFALEKAIAQRDAKDANASESDETNNNSGA